MRNIFFPIAFSIATAAAAAPPQRVEVSYQVAREGTILADVDQQLEHDGRSYRLSETWKGKGIYGMRGEGRRSSQGAVAADGLRPQNFENKRPGKDPQHAQFDPAARTPTLLQQDQLSVFWTFAFAPPRGLVTASVADGERVNSISYKVAGREKVKTPAGVFTALKLVKQKDNPQDKTTEVWLAVDRQYIPVRILVIDKDGARFDQVATRIKAK